jgi:hypothetical protein
LSVPATAGIDRASKAAPATSILVVLIILIPSCRIQLNAKNDTDCMRSLLTVFISVVFRPFHALSGAPNEEVSNFVCNIKKKLDAIKPAGLNTKFVQYAH